MFAPTTRPSTARGTLFVLASACCFSTISIFTLIGTGKGATLPSLMLGRYVLAVVVLVLVAGGLGAMRLPRARMWRLVLVGGLGQLCVNGFGLAALRYVPAATAGFLFYTFPVWITLWAALRKTEPLTASRVVALLLALTGTAFMVGTPWSGDVDVRGIVLALAAAISYAIYVPAINRAQRDLPGVVSATWISIAAGTCFLVVGALSGSLAIPQHVHAWGAIAGMAVISTVGGFLLFLRGLAALGAVRTAITSTIEPFSTSVLAALILGQKLGPFTLLGGVLIAAAVIVLQRRPDERTNGI